MQFTFGLAEAPAYLQQLISIVLQDCSEFAMAYLDDIFTFSKNEQEHLNHIEIIFKKLKEAWLKLKESKCDFFKQEIHYLDHLISVDRIQPLPKKLESIHNMLKSRSPKEIKQFLGLTVYNRKFVPWFSDMARPLTKLLAHDCRFVLNNQCDISFQMLKDTLCSVPITEVPWYNQAVHAVHWCKQVWMGRSTHTEAYLHGKQKRNNNGPPCVLH